MGLFKKLFGAGVVAGTTVAAMKVAEKVKANRPEGEAAPESAGVFDEVVKAAGELYQETAEAVKEKAPEVLNTIKEKAPEVVNTVKEKAPEVLNTVKEKAQQAVDGLKGDFGNVVDANTPETEPEADPAPEA